jgi:hypothetical protein
MDEALVEREVLHPPGALLAVDDLGKEVGVPPFGVHVGHREEAVEVVEPNVLRLGLDVLAHVPLAHRLGHVSRPGQQFGQRGLPVEPARLPVHGRPEQPVAHGEAAGHQRGPRRCAGGLRVTRREQHPAASQRVDVGRRSADGHAPAVAAEVTPADVIEQDQQDVGLLPFAAAELGQRPYRPLLLLGEDETGFETVPSPCRLRYHRVVGHRVRSSSLLAASGPMLTRLSRRLLPRRTRSASLTRSRPVAPSSRKSAVPGRAGRITWFEPSYSSSSQSCRAAIPRRSPSSSNHASARAKPDAARIGPNIWSWSPPISSRSHPPGRRSREAEAMIERTT